MHEKVRKGRSTAGPSGAPCGGVRGVDMRTASTRAYRCMVRPALAPGCLSCITLALLPHRVRWRARDRHRADLGRLLLEPIQQAGAIQPSCRTVYLRGLRRRVGWAAVGSSGHGWRG
jgi:hypothetical protein